MQLELNEQQKMIRNMVREFAEKEIAPVAAELDKKEEYPTEILKKMASLGLLGIIIPTEYGGAGLDTISYATVVEEISRKDASTGVITSVHNSLVAWPIMKYGTEEQKKKYLPILASGKKIGAFAATEPNAGSDLGAMATTAVLKGNKYIVNGDKTFITSGADAGIIIVFAVTDKSVGPKGISAFIVENDMKGFKVGSIFEKLGINASRTSELIFENMEVPKENLLGKEGDGFKIALSTLDGGRIGIAAQAVGIAQAALEESITYSKQREQFGRPIAKFQAIQWMIADMATKIEASRFLYLNACYVKDKGERYSKEAAMAKLFASETANEVANKALQIHGGYGYTKEYTVERLFRDAKITEIYEGTSEVQRMVISSSLLK
ncbi:MAG: acyl-CoA dehydrogenase [Candidatus Thermoplasmatota archaeon]|nr:acyl-CoA dehydrogenase [Candidatus Thermoplasmatota archaeon]MBU1941009.1 acyl-CoA dehydrogenase [Candidatus Thermoplasmatota archaeon]